MRSVMLRQQPSSIVAVHKRSSPHGMLCEAQWCHSLLQVPAGTAPDRLAHEVVSRAAAKVQRLLHYRSLPGAACRRQSHGSSAAAAGVSSANGPEAAASAAGTSEAVLLLERRLLSEVEAARERCKREAILARLQAELPSCQVGGCRQDWRCSEVGWSVEISCSAQRAAVVRCSPSLNRSLSWERLCKA